MMYPINPMQAYKILKVVAELITATAVVIQVIDKAGKDVR